MDGMLLWTVCHYGGSAITEGVPLRTVLVRRLRLLQFLQLLPLHQGEETNLHEVDEKPPTIAKIRALKQIFYEITSGMTERMMS